MDRSSPLYTMRRACQKIAYRILPHELLSKIYCRILIGEKVDIKHPKTFNEKLQWLNHNYNANNPLVVQCADKYQMRSYIEEKGYGHLLTPLIGVWERVDDIDWSKLPEKFVVKCTHGCAYNILCPDKKQFDVVDAKKKLSKWLKEDFSEFNVELHYGKIKPRRIICEEYLADHMTDFKFFCFNGEPQFFYVSTDLANDGEAKISYYDMNANRLPLSRGHYEDVGEVKMPSCLNEMIDVSRDLSSAFPFVRIDFFVIGNTYKFAEFTFTPGGAMMGFRPKSYDVEWGKILNLPM